MFYVLYPKYNSKQDKTQHLDTTVHVNSFIHLQNNNTQSERRTKTQKQEKSFKKPTKMKITVQQLRGVATIHVEFYRLYSLHDKMLFAQWHSQYGLEGCLSY